MNIRILKIDSKSSFPLWRGTKGEDFLFFKISKPIIIVLFLFFINPTLQAQDVDYIQFLANGYKILNKDLNVIDYPLFIKDYKIKSIKEFQINIEKQDTLLIKTLLFDTSGVIIQEDDIKFIYDSSGKIIKKVNLKNNAIIWPDYGVVIDGVFIENKFYSYILNRDSKTRLIDSNLVTDFKLIKHKLVNCYNKEVIIKRHSIFFIENEEIIVEDSDPFFLDRLEYYQNDKLKQVNYLIIERF